MQVAPRKQPQVAYGLSGITNKLFQYFIDNSLFYLEENHSGMLELSIEPELERAALLKSLEKFEEHKIVTRLDVDGKIVFLLNQPLQSFKQQIELSGATAGEIANVLSTYLQQNGKAAYSSINPMEINEWAIQDLAHIAEIVVAKCSPRDARP